MLAELYVSCMYYFKVEHPQIILYGNTKIQIIYFKACFVISSLFKCISVAEIIGNEFES